MSSRWTKKRPDDNPLVPRSLRPIDHVACSSFTLASATWGSLKYFAESRGIWATTSDTHTHTHTQAHTHTHKQTDVSKTPCWSMVIRSRNHFFAHGLPVPYYLLLSDNGRPVYPHSARDLKHFEAAMAFAATHFRAELRRMRQPPLTKYSGRKHMT